MALSVSRLAASLATAARVPLTDTEGLDRCNDIAQAIIDEVKLATVTINTGAVAVGALAGGLGVEVVGTASVT